MENPQSPTQLADLSQTAFLPECSDLGACAAFKAALMVAFASGGGLEIDAGQVRSIGTPMMQILASAIRSFASKDGRRVKIVNRSERFCEVADLLGFTPIFDGRES